MAAKQKIVKVTRTRTRTRKTSIIKGSGRKRCPACGRFY